MVTSSEVREGIPHRGSALHTCPERSFQRQRWLVRFGPLAHGRPPGRLHGAISLTRCPRDPGPAQTNERHPTLLCVFGGNPGPSDPETRILSGAMEKPARGQPRIWRRVARSQDHAGNARAHDHHAGRMECAHQPSAPSVLAEMDRDRPWSLYIRRAIAPGQERDSIPENVSGLA